MEDNPVRAGLCETLTDYPYSSARKYFQGIVDDLVDEYEIPILPSTLQAVAQTPVSKLAEALCVGSTTIGASTFS